MTYRRMKSIPASVKAIAQAGVFAILLATTLLAGGDAKAMLKGLLAVALTIATLTDLFFRRIPNWLVLGLLVQSVATIAILESDALPHHLLSGVFILGILLAMHHWFGGGEGDVKLLTAVGTAVGLRSGMEIIALGYMFAAVLAIVIAAGRFLNLPGRLVQQRTLPMAPFFGLATAYELIASGGLS